MNATRLLQWSLLACTAYFLAMSTAHFIGFKVPVLFVYWDVPSNHYQDMIIWALPAALRCRRCH